MQEYAIGQPCAGECHKTIDGISYTCLKCGVLYCYTGAYYARWKCPKCGTQLT